MTYSSVNSTIMTVTRAEAFSSAARIWAEARARRDALPVREAALAAYVPGGPSVEDLIALITAQRERARTLLHKEAA